MVLMPFSIPEHIEKLLSGAKRQTTRQPRKKPLKVGEVLHCYYRPRQKKSCENCIMQDCNIKNKILIDDGVHRLRYSLCSDHRNFFGTAKITSIVRVRRSEEIPEYELANYMCLFGLSPETYLETWARADGFANLQEAHKWFAKSTGNDQWMFLPWDVIIFEPLWLTGVE